MPEEITTHNNRLLEYTESQNVNDVWYPRRTVRYTYYVTGHVSNITIKDEWPGTGDPNDYAWYHDLALYYNVNAQLYRAVWDKWKWSGEPNDPFTDYSTLMVRDFDYDSPRALHAVRTFENLRMEDESWMADEVGMAQCTDYLGDQPYGEWQRSATWSYEGDPNDWHYDVQQSEAMRYLSGLGVHAQQTLDPNVPLDTRYLHGDLIRSTIMLTDETGQPVYPGGRTPSAVCAYTAFGEPVFDPNSLPTRYQFAGGHGCQAGWLSLSGVNPDLLAITLVHVGERWLDPRVGRFMQRNPTGIGCSLNGYAYFALRPLSPPIPWASFWNGGNCFHDWVARNFWLRFHSPEYINSPWAPVEAVGLSVAGGIGLYYGGAYCIALVRRLGAKACNEPTGDIPFGPEDAFHGPDWGEPLFYPPDEPLPPEPPAPPMPPTPRPRPHLPYPPRGPRLH